MIQGRSFVTDPTSFLVHMVLPCMLPSNRAGFATCSQLSKLQVPAKHSKILPRLSACITKGRIILTSKQKLYEMNSSICCEAGLAKLICLCRHGS